MAAGYKYKGAEALITMQCKYLKSFHKEWIKARVKNVPLPVTDDPDYASLEALLTHVLRSCGGYLKWICTNLELPVPEIEPVPAPEDITALAKSYIKHLTFVWSQPLVNVEPELFLSKSYKINWGPDISIESMLEHAAMHPLRHRYQLKNLRKQLNKNIEPEE